MELLPAAPTPKGLIPDHPIEGAAEDTLGRSSSATSFADNLLALDTSNGLVAGVLGPWGSGKTSYINLARAQFKAVGVPVVDFNPWMFSGPEHLVDAFFTEVAEALKLRPDLAEVGQQLEEYGELFSGLGWLPVVGAWLERSRGLTKLLAGGLRRSKTGSAARRARVVTALRKLSRPIIVTLDDIDRLTTQEIRDVFRLVRLTASFPNLIYLLAFDRARVEQSLTDSGVPGRDYLEKILQLAIDLPLVPEDVLNQQVFAALDQALASVPVVVELDGDVWSDHFDEIIRPVLRTMRDVRRYAAGVRGTVLALGSQVALADILALEAIRMFLPDVFSGLHANIELLTSIPSSYGGNSRDETAPKAALETLIAAGGPRADAARAMVQRLFPAAQRYLGNTHYGSDWQGRWLRNRRVAHNDVLRLYLERVASAGYRTFVAGERAWTLLADQTALRAYLISLPPDQLEEVIASLELYEDEYRSEHVVPGCVVLLTLLAEIPERQRNMFEFGKTMTVTRVTYRLLHSLQDPDRVEAAVVAILPQIRHLSIKYEVIEDVGYREGAGHKLVSEEAATRLEASWRDEVRAADIELILADPEPLGVFLDALRGAASANEPAIPVPTDPRLTIRVLTNARGEILSQSTGSRSVRRSPQLSWDALVAVYGGEEVLRLRLDEAERSGLSVDPDLWALAQQYLSGWRPRN